MNNVIEQYGELLVALPVTGMLIGLFLKMLSMVTGGC
jgi:hypothetical protein